MYHYLLIFLVAVAAIPLEQLCPKEPCLPNAGLINAGIDLITGDSSRAAVLDVQWSEDLCYPNPYNGLCYNIPANTTVNTISETIDNQGTLLFRNTDQIETWQSEQVTKDHVPGMYSYSNMTLQSLNSTQQVRYTGYVLCNYKFYNTILSKSAWILAPGCQRDIDALPDEYIQDEYILFYNTYGTHFATESTWGLKYIFLSQYKQCIEVTYNQEYSYQQVTTDGWKHSDEHTTSSGQTATDSYYSSRTMAQQSFQGGLPLYHSSDDWDLWVNSGANMVDPIRVSFSVEPIYILVSDPVKRANLEKAYYDIFAAAKQKQDQLAYQMTYGPRDVSFIRYQYDESIVFPNTIDPITILTPSTKISLSAGQSGPVIGTDGTCNHLTYYPYFYGHKYPAYYLMDRQQCVRDLDGQLSAKYVFNPTEWLNTVRQTTDFCINSMVEYINGTAKTSTKYYWQLQGSSYHGVSQSYYDPPYYPKAAADGEYVTHNMGPKSQENYAPQNGGAVEQDFTYYTSNGHPVSFGYSNTEYVAVNYNYNDYGSSLICYMDCDYIALTPLVGGKLDVSCSC
jgi:hypothetical protein